MGEAKQAKKEDGIEEHIMSEGWTGGAKQIWHSLAATTALQATVCDTPLLPATYISTHRNDLNISVCRPMRMLRGGWLWFGDALEPAAQLL